MDSDKQVGNIHWSDGRGAETIFEEADRLTEHDRSSQYGPSDEHHGTTATIFSLLMRRKYPDFPMLESGDVDMFFMADKLTREAHRHKRDNLVDLVAYAKLKLQAEDR